MAHGITTDWAQSFSSAPSFSIFPAYRKHFSLLLHHISLPATWSAVFNHSSAHLCQQKPHWQQQVKTCQMAAPIVSLEPCSTSPEMQSQGEQQGTSGCPEVTSIPFQQDGLLWSHSWNSVTLHRPLANNSPSKTSPVICLGTDVFKPQWNILESCKKIRSAVFEEWKRKNTLTA